MSTEPTGSPVELRLAFLRRARKTLVAYMLDKFSDEDWHGVMDAAADLRELDVEVRCLMDPLVDMVDG